MTFGEGWREGGLNIVPNLSEKHKKRRANRRRALPGFPWEGAFETTEAAREYVSGDRLQCLMCGKMYRSLGWHIHIHELDETAYKLRFGIPYGVGLVSSPTRAKHSSNAKVNMGTFDWQSALEKGRATLQLGVECRPIVQSVLAQRVERIRAIHELPPTIRQCAKCGNDVTVSGSRVLISDEAISCEECLAPASRRKGPMTSESRERLRQWANDNPDRSKEYFAAKNWWGWQGKPLPLLKYAAKWRARLRIIPELLEAAKLRGEYVENFVHLSSISGGQSVECI